MKHSLASFRRKLRALASERRGNVTVIFALAAIPIIGAMGAAVDYSRANSARTALQAAVDSTALMLSKDAAGLSSSQLNQKATAYFNAIFNRTEAKNAQVTPIYTSSEGSQLTVNGSAKVPTNFVSIMGFSDMTIAASSTVRWGNNKLRVALALDVTGSMSSNNKMAALKTAANGMIDQLKGAANKNGDVYVSIVPFSKDVNVGKSNYTANWLNWDDWDQSNGDCKNIPGGFAWGWYKKNKSACQSAGGTWAADDHKDWNGCVTDRDKDYDVKNTSPVTSNKSTLFVTEQYSSCPAALLPQTYDWTALKNKINELSPAGNTNQTIGLTWAWHSLTQAAPLNAPALDPKFKYQQVIVLMSDGMNTQNRWDNQQSKVDERMAKACVNVKAAGITVYSVLVMTSKSTVMENCASDPSKFFNVQSTGQLVSVFNEIGSALSQLRISK